MRHLLLILILFWAALRFYGLEKSPPGFYVDESTTSLNIMCLSQRGEGFSGDRHPIFPQNLSGGRNSPTFTYFGALWTRLFGNSVASFRGIAAFFGVLALIGMYLLGNVMGGPRSALLCVLVMAASPWAFQSSRVAWDACVPLACLPWALFFFLRPGGIPSRILSGLCFALSMYSYGASRIHVPVLLLLLTLHPEVRRRVGWRGLGITYLSLFLADLPLLFFTVWGDGLMRLRQVGIVPLAGARPSSGSAFFVTLIQNLALHLSPRFLFWSGDENLRHSTYFFGQLGWLDILALGLALPLVVCSGRHVDSPRPDGEVRPWSPRFVVYLSLIGILSGILPAAMTWDSLPHGLRSSGTAPFFAFLSGWLLWRASEYRKWLLPLVAAVAFFYTGVFLESYFIEYPKVAAGYFDTYVPASINRGGSRRTWERFYDENSSYHEAALRFFLASSWGMECRETQRKIDEQKAAQRAYSALR